MTTSTFYHAFEAAFRGSREQIIERLQGYNPFLEPLSRSGLLKVALDLGCGRGEWLEILGQFEFNAHGVDLDDGMLADCRAAGLSCEHLDALSALASSKDESLGVLSAFHLIEHLPFESVRTIITDGLRALAPGGLLILETPNPENIEVGTVTFHNDSTHVAPIPPNVLKFLAEHAGYSKIKLQRLNELPLENSRVVGLSDVLFGASPDYALVAQKAGPDDLMAATGAAFAAETGRSTRDLASAFEETQEHAFNELRREMETLRTRLKAQDEKIARLKKTKKTRLYYKSRLIRILDGQIKSWLSRRREIGRVKAAAVRRASAKNVPQIDRTRKWHTVSLPETLHWRLEGPFDSSYSLALVNRELARGLQRQGVRVQLKSSEGPGDFEPDPKFMADNPDLASMQKTKFGRTDTVSRNMYPPRVVDLGDALPGLHSYAWEETGFPHDYVASFNDVLRYLTVTSDHVRKVMIDNGVFIPSYTVGNGVDHLEEIDPEPVAGLPENGTLFLHVSSCFPRKGVDALLEAWAQAFTKRDDVTLLIKSFPNPHNTVAEQISELRLKHPDLAPIHLINEDLSDGQMRFLYGSCDIAVFPSRAEGFGLPMAEALLMGKPVLTTGWSGQMDFADLPLVRTIDYRFEQTKSHVGTGLSMWADPDPDHMAELMREAAAAPAPSEADFKRTRDLLLDRFNWDEVAKRSIAAVRHAVARPKPIPPRVGWVTTYNSRCGIATYSEHLIRYLRLPVHVLGAHTNNPVEPDDSLSEAITRCWKEGREDAFSDLLSVIRAEDLQTIVIQFNYGFFNFANLAQLIHTLKDEGRQVVITLHATDDTPHPREIQLESIRDALAKCDRILVHKVLDANRMKALGLVENVTLFPHGVLPMVNAPAPRKLPETEPFKIGSYGFFLPNKGLPELVEAVALLRNTGRNVQLHLVNAEYPVGESRQLIDAVRGQVDQHDLDDIVEIETDFLSDDAALSKLSKCDLIVFGYQRSSESASGAVRYGLISGRPVAVTPLEIFSDVAQYSISLPGMSPREMADGISTIINHMRGDDGPSLDKELQNVLDRSRAYCTDRSYLVLGARLKGILTALWDEQVNGFTTTLK